MLMACSLTGIIPFNLVGSAGNERFEVTYFGLINAFITMTIFVICLLITVIRAENFVSYFFKTDISQLTSMIQMFISLVAMAVVWPSCFWKKLKLISLFRVLTHIDVKLAAIGQPPEYDRIVGYALKCIAGNCAFYSIYIVGSYLLQVCLERQANLNSWITYFLPHLVLSFVVLKFMCIMWQIRRRFYYLNQVRKLFKNMWKV